MEYKKKIFNHWRLEPVLSIWDTYKWSCNRNVCKCNRKPSSTKQLSVLSVQFAVHYITKTHLFTYIENYTTKKGKFSDKNSDIVHISAKNID